MANKYPACDHITRSSPELKVDKEIADAIGRDFRTLPIFEKGLHEYTYRKHYSLQTNEYLKCRWAEYKRTITDRVFAPFELLNIRDYHFYNYKTRLIASENIFSKTDFRYNLKPGPGVDSRGEMPIPQELIMRRGEQPSKAKRVPLSETVKKEKSKTKFLDMGKV